MELVKKLRDFLLFILLWRKTSLGFSKIDLFCPKFALQVNWSKRCERGFFGGRVVFRTPPEVVRGFFFFGGGGVGSTVLWR
jgi:hypothetical protein